MGGAAKGSFIQDVHYLNGNWKGFAFDMCHLSELPD